MELLLQQQMVHSTITATDSSTELLPTILLTISGAVSLGGLITADVLNQEYQITEYHLLIPYTFIAKRH